MPFNNSDNDLDFSDEITTQPKARAPNSNNVKQGLTQTQKPVGELWTKGLKDTTIQKDDYSDPNFVRKYLWEISGKPQNAKPITLWSYGQGRFIGSLIVYANPSFYPEMAKAMLKLYPDSKAIFMAGLSKKMILIMLDGKVMEQVVPFSHKSHNKMPYNDWGFMNLLPAKLEQVANAVKAKSDIFKAWANVKENSTYQFTNKKFDHDEILEQKPNMFGIEGAKSILQARLEAEQNGWVKLELKPNPLPAAIVVALNVEQAWKGAKILARYRDVSTWSVLLIKTNKNTSSLKGDQILHFIQTGDVEGASPVTNVEKLA